MKVINILALIATLLTSAANAAPPCSSTSVYAGETKDLREFLVGSSVSVGSFIFEGKFLPLPNRFVIRAPSDRVSYSSAVLPIGSQYFGCDASDVPRGMLEIGVRADCEYCDELPSDFLQKLEQGRYTMLRFEVGKTRVGVIYSPDSYIQLIDNNPDIIGLWWSVLSESK